ncbi:anaerobic dehydrogenase, typically selenocysteine-containing [Desulfitobacterium dehalogenans ATCC 51507]|uniref:Anaerobic dehydrogenase, typically selenocysteine-containing n=1 Tax=Desulfitobacterium dehalogenans (strain ATCC 51507 / DSM 9161 / JW/IU-DC1) TaxID=756499 RepID=I4AAF2_DESDJ|nr:molybdopterin-dependent oxidoreductase [Desulfitobacterium dehalogenans]AFM00937.1 anaerobic dehydrogenase, typically selenocysteine-containing [Desulfitobacterium dehalogenans ATCC 51507]
MAYVRVQGLHRNRTPMPNSDKVKTSICCLCNGGCGLKVQIGSHGNVEAIYGDPDNPYNKGKICPKPIEIIENLHGPERVQYPMKKVNGEFVRISWEEAIDTIAKKYKELSDNFGTGSIIGMTSKIGGSFSKFALKIFSEIAGFANYGTGPICFSSEEKVRKEMFGKAAATAPLHDVIYAKIVLNIGNNCAQTKAGQFHWLQEGQKHGAKIITIDTRYTETAQLSDQFIQINPGTDGALGMALLHLVIKNKHYDEEFVHINVNGFEELAEAVKDFTAEKAAKITGIPQKVIEDLAHELGTQKPAIMWPGRGIVCVNNAEHALMAFESLMAILGNVGKPGSGVVSHLNGYGQPANLIKPEHVVKPSFKLPADKVIEGMESGQIKMMYIAGNPCANWPESSRMKKAIGNLELVVSHTLTLDDSASLAHIVLPATHWLEEAGMQPGIHRVMQWRDKAVEPYGEAKPAAEVFKLIAEKMGLPSEYFPDTPEEAWDVERKLIGSISAITVEKMTEKPGGVHYPYPEGGEENHRLYSKGFNTSSKKVELLREKGIVLKYRDPLESPGNESVSREDYPYFVSSVKVAAHYHTQCQYSKLAREFEKPYVEIHPQTAVKIGIKDDETIRIETPTGAISLPVKLTYSVPQNHFFTQPYFGKRYNLDPINTLLPSVLDQPGGNFPHKNILCRAYPEGGCEK